MGYEDPALEGDSITLICPSGSLLSRPNSSISMGNGEWEPDPREKVCIGELMTTGTTIYNKYVPKIYIHLACSCTVICIL